MTETIDYSRVHIADFIVQCAAERLDIAVVCPLFEFCVRNGDNIHGIIGRDQVPLLDTVKEDRLG